LTSHPAKWVSLAIAAAALAVGGLLVAYRLIGVAAGPEAELIALLRQTERDGLRLSIPGTNAPLVSRSHHFDRFSVRLGPNGDTAEVACTLDFTGKLDATEVSSVGLERAAFEYRDGRWWPVSGIAPRLTEVLSALELRRQSVEKRSEGEYQAAAWFIRLEREQAIATEDYLMPGKPAEAVTERRGTRRFVLQRQGNKFLFSEGIL
jgi:hypothetical protein